ncbi:MFS family permease [Robbsia andropogonis]
MSRNTPLSQGSSALPPADSAASTNLSVNGRCVSVDAPTGSIAHTPVEPPGETFNPAWRRNLAVCVFGSFTTLIAMTLLLPFLPLYVQELGVQEPAAIARWSGLAFGATFFGAAVLSPVWGHLADKYGRKLMMIRASLGMAITMSLLGMVHDVWQLTGLRLLAGILGGYASGSMILVATQTPKARVGWALGTLSSGIMFGNLVGPLIGGVLPKWIGIRWTFIAAGGVIFIAFLATTFLIKEDPQRRKPKAGKETVASGDQTRLAHRKEGWAAIPQKGPVVAMLVTGMLLMFANMSIEPIITLFVAQLVDTSQVTVVSGLTMSAAALGSVLSASRLGKLADRVGHWRVIIGCMTAAAILLVPQAFVQTAWQLVLLRFMMGLALGGLLPCVASVIRHRVPAHVAGSMLGYSTSSQYAGQVTGPLAGGLIGGALGMRSVFLGTAALMAVSAAMNVFLSKRYALPVPASAREDVASP